MTPGEHIDAAEGWMNLSDRTDVAGVPLVAALYVLKALAHANIAQAQLALWTRHDDSEM